MPKFLVQISYTTEGVRGLQKEGGTARRAAAQKLVESVGGKLEAFYFAFGAADVIAIADVPDNVAAFATALATVVTGTVKSQTTVLVTPEEVDQAAKKAVSFRPAGG
ncbi:MAG TPA: GYD domain-containing protein [Candidatus Tumulicola sp.]|nr:GYD domain-containing protein [Candidatus Tumulicola sp.]